MAQGISAWLRLVRADCYRYTGRRGWRPSLRTFLLVPGFKYSFWLRSAQSLARIPGIGRAVSLPARAMLRRYRHKFGISIPASATVGEGLYVGHFGGIVVSGRAVIGRNCNLSQNTTIGKSNRGPRSGVPTIGDNVYIGPGAVIIGNITIGNNVAVGANSVVLHSVPDNAVVVGAPARVASYNGSSGYISHTESRGAS